MSESQMEGGEESSSSWADRVGLEGWWFSPPSSLLGW